jgi:hypothetical protein
MDNNFFIEIKNGMVMFFWTEEERTPDPKFNGRVRRITARQFYALQDNEYQVDGLDTKDAEIGLLVDLIRLDAGDN